MPRHCALLLTALLLVSNTFTSRASEAEPFRFPTRPLGVPTGSASDSLFGFVTSNMTLTKSAPGPIWHVIGDLYVQPGVTLTIEPGVTLLFDSNSDILNSGNYYSKSEILLSGTMLANGAVDDSVRFQSTTGLPSSWGQVRVETSGTASLNYCSLKDADIAIQNFTSSVYGSGNHVSNGFIGIKSWASGCLVRRWTFDHLTSGVHVAGTGAEVAECVFTGPITNGVIVGNDTNANSYLRLHHCLFSGVTTGLFYDRFATADPLVNYCTFDGCSYGLRRSTNSGNGSAGVRNCIVTNCSTGLQGGNGTSWLMDYCDVWNAPYNGAAADSGVVAINPLYVDPANRNYHLKSFSPLRVLGENGTQMGAYGAEGNVVGVPDGPSQPGLVAQPASPNPFQASTELSFTLRTPSAVAVTILDSSGRLVRTLMIQELGSGVHRITWNGETDSGKPASSGLYYWRVASAGESAGGRLTYLR